MTPAPQDERKSKNGSTVAADQPTKHGALMEQSGHNRPQPLTTASVPTPAQLLAIGC